MRRALPLLAVLSLAFAPAPLPRKERANDLDRLRGEWTLVSMTVRGFSDPAAPDAAIIEGGRITYFKGGRVASVWTLSVGTRSAPRRCVMRGPGDTQRLVAAGVYALDGDVLTMCYRYA